MSRKRYLPALGLALLSPVVTSSPGYAGSTTTLKALVGGLGLLRSPDDSIKWERLSNDFGDWYLLHLAIDSNYPEVLYAITNTKEVLASDVEALAGNPSNRNYHCEATNF